MSAGRTDRSTVVDSNPAILVVDDSSAKRLSIEAVLELLGHEVVCVESGEAALQQVMRRAFAVILMDVQMPGMDGYETARFIQHQALHDNLTGLPNRVLFGDRVQHAIRSAVRAGESLAVLVMDLDEFKHVNDTLGHQHGDVLLQLVAERLVSCLRDGDTVARLGGDEFGILPLAPTDLAGAATIAWKVAQALEAPFLVHGHSLDVRASIGITLVPEHGDNIDDLLRRADLAMYDAKRSGGGYALFAAEQEETPARRLALLSDLRRCVERDELVLHYQPKIDLPKRETTGVEALVRWNHPSGRLMMPDAFMPEVERTALMMPLTVWVLDDALRTLRSWRDQGYDLTMAVNLGALCLTEGNGLFETVEQLTSKWEIPADKLTLELTESALIDTALPGLLARLEDMDARLAIDDFGTGYSSLVYLQRLPVVEIKADRSFVTTMASVKDDAVIVRSIIDLAHNLGLRVVAEGVEDEANDEPAARVRLRRGPGLLLQPSRSSRRPHELA